jgi:hypothetical protein
MSITGELSEGGPSRHSEPVGDGCRRHHDATATSVPAAVTAKEAVAPIWGETAAEVAGHPALGEERSQAQRARQNESRIWPTPTASRPEASGLPKRAARIGCFFARSGPQPPASLGAKRLLSAAFRKEKRKRRIRKAAAHAGGRACGP